MFFLEGLHFKRSRAGFFEYSMANLYGYDLGAIYNAMSGPSVTPLVIVLSELKNHHFS
jgi:RNAse (barnase) inhibitor barstar